MANRMFKPPQTVVLCDLDDTLTDRGDIPHTTILATLHSLGFTHTTLDELKKSNGISHIHTRYGIDERIFWDRFNEIDRRPEHLRQGLITLYSDVGTFLDRLHHAGIPVHIVTNTPPGKAQETIRYLKLEQRINGWEAYPYPCQTPQPKPHPDLAYQALAALQFPLHKNGKRIHTDGEGPHSPHILVVGDEECDINLAANLKKDLTEKEIDAVVHGIHVNHRGTPLSAEYTTGGPHHLLFAADIIQYHSRCPLPPSHHQTRQEQS